MSNNGSKDFDSINVCSKNICFLTVNTVWVSDQGSQLKNEVMEHLAKSCRIRHSLTVVIIHGEEVQ